MSFKLKSSAEPAQEKMTVSFRISADLFRAFEIACEEADVSVSEGLRQLIAQFLKPKR